MPTPVVLVVSASDGETRPVAEVVFVAVQSEDALSWNCAKDCCVWNIGIDDRSPLPRLASVNAADFRCTLNWTIR